MRWLPPRPTGGATVQPGTGAELRRFPPDGSIVDGRAAGLAAESVPGRVRRHGGKYT